MPSVESVLEQIGISAVTIGSEIACHCPFHTDNHPSFSINAVTGLWTCYSCGRGGNLSMLLQEVAVDLDLSSDLREIKRKRPVEKQSELTPRVDSIFLRAQYESFKRPPDWALEERFISVEEAERYGVKWDTGWILPCWSPDREFLGWQFKRLDVVSNYPRGVKKSRTLFGFHEVRSKTIALVESPLDAVRLATAGISAVASYGAMVSANQVALLIDLADTVLLALDNDQEGKRQTDKIASSLRRRVDTRIVSYPDGCKDPGDIKDDEQIRELFH